MEVRAADLTGIRRRPAKRAVTCAYPRAIRTPCEHAPAARTDSIGDQLARDQTPGFIRGVEPRSAKPGVTAAALSAEPHCQRNRTVTGALTSDPSSAHAAQVPTGTTRKAPEQPGAKVFLPQPIDSTAGMPRFSTVTRPRLPRAQSAEFQILAVPCLINTAR